jgi:hypothetical protein
VLTPNKLQTLTYCADPSAVVVRDSQYLLVVTVSLIVFKQQKISFTNYSWAISHINDGPKSNVLEICSIPITRLNVVRTHNGDRAVIKILIFNQSLMWLIAQK